MVIVKMNGEKVRLFKDPIKAAIWADKHCQGKIEIVSLRETKLPAACKMNMRYAIQM